MVNSINASNFLSWKNLDFKVQSGITLIDGWNEDDQTAEGSGKSAIFNALSWCLYGRVPKDVNIDDVIKNGETSCQVSVVIGDKKIVRSRKPNDLFIEDLNTGHKIKGKDLKETQILIEDFTTLSFDAFCQVIYFAQNYGKKFITSNQEERGKILSEIQNLDLFDKSRKEVQALLKKEDILLVQLKSQLQLEESTLKGVESAIQRELHIFKLMRDTKLKKISDLKDKLNAQSSKIQTLHNLNNELSSQSLEELDETILFNLETDRDAIIIEHSNVTTQINQIELIIKQYNKTRANLNVSLEKYKKLNTKKENLLDFIKNPIKKCPTCGSASENLDIHHSELELSNIENEQSELLKYIEELDAEVSKGEPSKTKLDLKLKEINKKSFIIKNAIDDFKKNKINKDQRLVKQSIILNDISNAQQTFNDIKSQLNDLEQSEDLVDLNTLEQLESQKVSQLDKIQSLKNVIIEKDGYVNSLNRLKDGFRDIKSFIFNNVLNELNTRVSNYLDALFEVPVSVKFINEDMKIQTLVFIDNQERSLGLLSGGQYRRVSLAVDLALSDIILSRKGNKLNLLILDEYFKDLSEQSMTKCLNLLETRASPVLLIEHNSIFKSIVNNTFFVSYNQGTSENNG